GTIYVNSAVIVGPGIDDLNPCHRGGRGGDLVFDAHTVVFGVNTVKAGRGGDSGAGMNGGRGGDLIVIGEVYGINPAVPVEVEGGDGGTGGPGIFGRCPPGGG